MAKSDTQKAGAGTPTGTQTELVATTGTGSTASQDETTQRQQADLTAQVERMEREKRALAEREATLRRREAEMEQAQKSLEERAAEFSKADTRQRQDATATPMGDTTNTDAESEEVAILNNSARAIGAPNSKALLPLQVTVLSRATFNRWLDDQGRYVPGVAKHFTSTDGKPPALQVVSLANLSALPEQHALGVVEKSEDVGMLEKFRDTESRPAVKDAVKRRLDALRKR